MTNDQTSRTATRRALLAGVVAGAATSHAVAAEVDPHPAWLAAWEKLDAELNASDPTRDLQQHPDHDAWLDLPLRIAATPAHTAAGVRAKLALIHDERVTDEAECLALTTAIQDLARMA